MKGKNLYIIQSDVTGDLKIGRSNNARKRLRELHGAKWYQITSIDEHMADIREYYEYVLRINHRKQWDDHRFWGNISEDKVLE